VIVPFVFALLTQGADPLQYFIGKWRCVTPIPAAANAPARTFTEYWSFARAMGGPWVRVEYRHGKTVDGTAYVGHVAAKHRYVYADFHADGSYASLSSPAPSHHRWVWTGSFFTPDGKVDSSGRITYDAILPDRYDRTFEQRRSSGWHVIGSDTCKRP
jgi:hypothetical protein